MFTLARIRLAATVLMGLALTQPALGDHPDPRLEAITGDGRLVILHENHRWEFEEVAYGDPKTSAVLAVTEVKEMQDACGLQLHLQNNTGQRIRSLTPRLTVYNDDNIIFDHKSVSFTSIKPGRDQYRRLQFNGIGCHAIRWVRLHDAEHCTIGNTLDKFNAEEGQCLALIHVVPTDLINLSKQPNL